MKFLPVSFFFLILLPSCAKYMDDQHPGADSAAMRDSAAMLAMKQMVLEKLSGIWVRSLATQPGDEGYNIKPDGSLALINMYPVKGDKWEVRSDSLILYIHTEKNPTPAPNIYRIEAVTDSTLTLIPQNAPSGYKETYRKKNFTLPPKFAEFYKQEFRGKLKPMQTIGHRFEIKRIFDGGITLFTADKNIRFILLKDDVEVSVPVTEWTGSFPPGSYALKVYIATGEMAKGAASEYTISIEEK